MESQSHKEIVVKYFKIIHYLYQEQIYSLLLVLTTIFFLWLRSSSLCIVKESLETVAQEMQSQSCDLLVDNG